jgi:hypothetical protein
MLGSIIARQVLYVEISINNDTISAMPNVDEILTQMRRNPKGIRFNDLSKVCEYFFGSPRQSGSSHRIFRTPWQGDPRVNIQNSKGKAKPYQVRQVLQAIDRLEVKNDKKT